MGSHYYHLVGKAKGAAILQVTGEPPHLSNREESGPKCQNWSETLGRKTRTLGELLIFRSVGIGVQCCKRRDFGIFILTQHKHTPGILVAISFVLHGSI